MTQITQHSTPDLNADKLVRLAETLGLDIAADDLAALAKQLRLLDALERDELQEYPPILKMDADWYD